MSKIMQDKSLRMLRFLKETASIRRPRITGYRSDDRLLWFSNIPKDFPEIRSPIHIPPTDDSSDHWIEVKKTSQPVRESLPRLLADWLKTAELDSPDTEPELLQERTVLIEREIPDPDAPEDAPRLIKETVPETRRRQDYPELEDAWVEYYVNHWEPWAKEMRRWREVQRVYEELDFMRRRLEESEERFELFLGLGLLQWRDSTDRIIKRHLLAGPAEIVFDAGRGLITIVPAASFETFKLELDMLEATDRPRLDDSPIQGILEELETRAWERTKVGEILREIANRAQGDSQVDEDALEPVGAADSTFRIFFAPALILRERRLTAFEEGVTKLIEKAETLGGTLTKPWIRLLAEGQPIGEDDQPRNRDVRGDSDECIYFPLPTNAKQLQIVRRLQYLPGVVVKGPPGTGKSHTIANLMCHLLATGEKILVTAQAPKALTVLRDMLPRDMQDLCLMSLGSSREDQRQLESGVRTIIGKKNRWDQGESDRVSQKIADLEEKRQSFQQELSEVERSLREVREAETYSHVLDGGYEGTAAQIARRLDDEKQFYGWFPAALHDKPSFPFSRDEVQVLAEMHARLTPAGEEELRAQIGDFDLPPPEEFQKMVDVLLAAEQQSVQVLDQADPKKLDLLQNSPTEVLAKAAQALQILDEKIFQAQPILENLEGEILTDLFVGRKQRWRRLSQEALAIADRIGNLREQLDDTEILIPSGYDNVQLRADVAKRLGYFEQGRRRSFLGIKPKIIKETQYIEDNCLVLGRPANTLESLQKLNLYFRLATSVEEFFQLWPYPLAAGSERRNIFQVAIAAVEKASTITELLEVFENQEEECLAIIPPAERIKLVDRHERLLWQNALAAELARRQVQEAKRPLCNCQQEIQRCIAAGSAHTCLTQLEQAIQERNTVAWQTVYEQREAIRRHQQLYRRYQDLLARLEDKSKPLITLLRQNQGDPQWQPRLLSLEQAWYWASACGWLEDLLNPQRYAGLIQRHHRLKDGLEKLTEEVASELAWQAFFCRLDEGTIQNLFAWTHAVARIGQGTGRHAYRHRRTARAYLTECLPKIPAWIMPLHKLWDSIEAQPGLFDTVIIDEASQAEINSLVLLLLTKRVIVVGDKMQNSPEAVGIKEDDIDHLTGEHLHDFHFRAEFRPDTSLFDHAERAFGNLISLREHFRCVPEIISFSNNLCYPDAPLIPLRQAPVDRLPPLQHTFISGGFCEGEGQRIRNEIEAEKLVETIQLCLNDEAYEGKSMGVIALQGRAQSDLIERKLAEVLEPKIIAERKLRCGVPATFQGDQRDVIFLSLVAATSGPDQAERRLRALTGLDFQRRFNVAMSRAKDQVWLFHSVAQSDLSPDCLRRRLLRFFQSPWYAAGDMGEDLDRLAREAARRPRVQGEQPDPFESWFEVDVALELLRKGYRVRPQYEVAGYRIDLVVEGLQSRLAIECNGDVWHGPDRYEYDMARQRQLERVGWNFAIVWASEFYINRERALQETIQACNDLGIYPVHMESDNSKETKDESGKLAIGPEVESENGSLEPDESGKEPEIIAGPFTSYSDESGFPDPREAPLSNICAAIKAC